MARFRFHKLAALAVLFGVGAWVATGEFSSVGSAQNEAPPTPAEAAAEVKAPLRTVAVITPPRVEHARAIRISGHTDAEKRVTLATRVMGVIDELPVKQGERVERGELVMRLEAEDKEAAVRMAESLVTQRQAEADAAERLVSGGNAPRLQADQARASLATAKSQLEGAKAELAQYSIYAPYNGVVDRIPVQRGSAILAGTEVATLINLDPLLAIGEVSERDLRYLKPGNTAQIRLVDGTVTEGTLRYVSRDASPATRTFRIEVAIPNEDKKLPAGMTAEIVLLADPADSVVLPRSVVTLSSNGDLGIRAVDKDNKVVFFPIDLVDDTPKGLVLAGIPADARVIVAGQDLVSDGDEVKPVEADLATVQKLAGETADGT
ncbi:efflux RND transporter periplasmic adaptor subunit [Mesorhizobium sp. YM1C-6-2]|uniref:efflux RND transporter periplasmic adaptor subunit n=1 Tax=Mesorhizobium sp. YM1C-6-2 TaxID=1827501 RepID=UPI000EF19EB9|nr:efflux RND transporter periplasmic adaptor subunit [Mesorhizobium sp. YM1C-6-2]RLP25914.1 efflux RND transporter periplasmic adaptor subunit [Mesorhizobium sp. YM1C-6-2]